MQIVNYWGCGTYKQSPFFRPTSLYCIINITCFSAVEDIDAYIGGLSENRLGDGIIGETFSCIIAEQFARLRSGDRFWYENDLPFPNRLTDGNSSLYFMSLLR